MGLIECASSKSIWRAIDYVERDKIVCWEQEGKCYDGIVEGSNVETYKVHVDIEHPKKSTCTCPFATDHKVICKHMLAIYFSAEPKKLEEFYKLVEDEEEQERRWQEEHEKELYRLARNYSKEELVRELVDAWLELEEYRHSRR